MYVYLRSAWIWNDAGIGNVYPKFKLPLSSKFCGNFQKIYIMQYFCCHMEKRLALILDFWWKMIYFLLEFVEKLGLPTLIL